MMTTPRPDADDPRCSATWGMSCVTQGSSSSGSASRIRTFGLLYDDARLAFDGALPTSYVVQGRPDPVKDAYLRSLGVNTINLDWWEDLPQFLAAKNPDTA